MGIQIKKNKEKVSPPQKPAKVKDAGVIKETVTPKETPVTSNDYRVVSYLSGCYLEESPPDHDSDLSKALNSFHSGQEFKPVITIGGKSLVADFIDALIKKHFIPSPEVKESQVKEPPPAPKQKTLNIETL